MHAPALLFLLLIGSAYSLYAQPSGASLLHGVVTELPSGEEVPFAQVRIEGARLSATTDMAGKFAIALPDSLWSTRPHLRIEYLGFVPYRKRIRKSDLRKVRTFALRPAKFNLCAPPVIHR